MILMARPPTPTISMTKGCVTNSFPMILWVAYSIIKSANTHMMNRFPKAPNNYIR